ncbi:MAG TPA: 50S ribosomal protein L35 [Actinomycetota bacterium]|nr:50S ribosomal protein L35 [Actinomycetota bacterium]
MPKQKTHRGAAKRFRTTGTGKIVRVQGHVAHYLEHKPGQLRRRLQRPGLVSPADTKRVKKMLGM